MAVFDAPASLRKSFAYNASVGDRFMRGNSNLCPLICRCGRERIRLARSPVLALLSAGRAGTARGDSRHIRINPSAASQNASGWARRRPVERVWKHCSETEVASKADLIITGDADLLTLGSHAGVPIIDPAEAITRSAARPVEGRRVWATEMRPARQFMSNGGYSRNTLAAVTILCFVTVRGGRVSPASRRRASGSTS
jgi:hypothetical protein